MNLVYTNLAAIALLHRPNVGRSSKADKDQPIRAKPCPGRPRVRHVGVVEGRHQAVRRRHRTETRFAGADGHRVGWRFRAFV
jgi:hypothetical protein